MTDMTDDYDLLDLHEGLGIHSNDSIPRAGLDVPIDDRNLGFKLLQKMGWSVGKGLGKNLQGRVDPIPVSLKLDTTGVGKETQMNEAHVESTARRKALESEVIGMETEVDRMKREIKVGKYETIKEEIKAVTAAFYCSICDKQYSKISEYETHLSSYDHHHRKRFKEMQDMQKNNPLQSAKKRAREDKERVQEEREMKRLQEAAMAKNGVGTATVNHTGGSVHVSGGAMEGVVMATPLVKPVGQKVAFSFGAKPAAGKIAFSLNKK
ncbi:hypothetical protein BC829DRAFT_392143 [Chytridium lagenaria]|nr:hypothetical protein BC829DRAFT_392143 [Chytridium lagenaria]